MKKRLNNRGYMLVEIIFASVLAVTVAYFITDLTIKLKNKNDDLLVKTLAVTDQAIIYNTIMKDLYSDNYPDGVNCNDVSSKISIDTSSREFSYNGFTNIVSEYVKLGVFNCVDNDDYIEITIPLEVSQLPDDDFNVNIRFNK